MSITQIYWPILQIPKLQSQNNIKIAEALKYGYELLDSVPGHRLDVELLLSHLLQVSRTFLFAQSEQLIPDKIFKAFQQLCRRRLAGEPVAYLVGVKEFWSLELEVNTHTLIPRPETETLVEITLDLLPKNLPLTVADLGVGSGAVAMALATERPHWEIYASDVSLLALEVAKRNIDRYDLQNIRLLQSNWCLNLDRRDFDAIISNPPYIAETDPHLPSLVYEPFQALVSGEEGLHDLGLIIQQAGDYLKANGYLFLEHGYNQADSVCDLMHQAGFGNIKSHADLNGIYRVTSGVWGLSC